MQSYPNWAWWATPPCPYPTQPAWQPSPQPKQPSGPSSLTCYDFPPQPNTSAEHPSAQYIGFAGPPPSTPPSTYGYNALCPSDLSAAFSAMQMQAQDPTGYMDTGAEAHATQDPGPSQWKNSLRHNSTRNLYPFTAAQLPPAACFLTTTSAPWHERLDHPGAQPSLTTPQLTTVATTHHHCHPPPPPATAATRHCRHPPSPLPPPPSTIAVATSDHRHHSPSIIVTAIAAATSDHCRRPHPPPLSLSTTTTTTATTYHHRRHRYHL
ncbi:proline-rich receptor-like protein kinase PERK8 [Helianthus annuus]|uniref:proline-rich receptor-like protein kinase PERK8 n=1 Tax=Helianthus annuus TaxID=4232 RepID=UPI001653256B|nr:proline-rich receptor-like protein kinase PERK8 [Helianthus annuus]